MSKHRKSANTARPKPDGLEARFDENWAALPRGLQDALIREREAYANPCALCAGPVWDRSKTHYGLLCGKCRWDEAHDPEVHERYVKLAVKVAHRLGTFG